MMNLVRVFMGTEIEASIIRSVLEEDGIKTVVEGANIATIAPYAAGPAGIGSVRVCVRSNDAERARELIAEKRDDA